MTRTDEEFLKVFFRKVVGTPLSPGDERYVRVYEDRELTEYDPVNLLARAIEWTPHSVQLFSGYRGTGKSTELRRLKKRLEDDGYLVFLCDIEDALNLSVPVDVSDFLMAVSGVFSTSVNERLGDSEHDYWKRLEHFLKRVNVQITDVSAFGIKVALKGDPGFRRQLQTRMAGHLGAFVADVHEFLEECVGALRRKHGSDREIVLLLDSVEHIRGTSANAGEVHSSVETLFAGHSEKLHFPYLHVVYTVPPYLKIRYPNIGALYDPGGLQILPAVKLRQRQPDGDRVVKGFDVLERVVSQRGDWRRLLSERSSLDRLIEHSGGHLRDLMRLVAEVLRRATTLPVSDRTVDSAINQLRTEYLPISNEDARWLAAIARTHTIALRDQRALPVLMRFFDSHLVLCYRNGEEWYDVHPLISQHVQEQVDVQEAGR